MEEIGIGVEVHDDFLSNSEKIVYDTKNYDLTVDKENSYRGLVTNQRVIFVTENKIRDVANTLIASLTFTRKIYHSFLTIGILLMIFGGIIFAAGVTNFSRDLSMTMGIFTFPLLIAGSICILIFLGYRPERLTIFTTGNKIEVTGPVDVLKKIMMGIRSDMGLHY